MEWPLLIDELKKVLKEGTVMIDEEMSKHTSFRIGGPAKLFIVPADKEELVRAVAICREAKAPYFVLGNGSNLLVSDAGYEGVVIHAGGALKKLSLSGTEIEAEAGATLAQMAALALKASLTGMEFAAGIPGSLGGACMMNAGAYGGEMKDILLSVQALDPQGHVVEFPAKRLELSYRHSMLMDKAYIVLSAKVRLSAGDAVSIKERMDELKAKRLEKQPLEYPSAGSTFKRPEGCFAGKLIQDAGLKGYRVGGAMVSEKHSGFVINVDHASAKDVCDLISYVKKRVLEDFGKELEPEIRFLGFADR